MSKNIETVIRLLEEDVINAKEAKILILAINKNICSENITNEKVDELLGYTPAKKSYNGIKEFLELLKEVSVVCLIGAIDFFDFFHKYISKLLKWLLSKADKDSSISSALRNKEFKFGSKNEQVEMVSEDVSSENEVLESTIFIDPVVLHDEQLEECLDIEQLDELNKLDN